jgi:hypothetical protein
MFIFFRFRTGGGRKTQALRLVLPSHLFDLEDRGMGLKPHAGVGVNGKAWEIQQTMGFRILFLFFSSSLLHCFREICLPERNTRRER